MQKSWKTTVSGIVAILGGLGMIGKIISDFVEGQPVSMEQASVAIAAIGGGIGLIFAQDGGNAGAEQSGS